MSKYTRFGRLGVAASALVAVGALGLAGCATTGTPTSNAPAGGGEPAADGCGSVPQIGSNDPNGLLDGFSPEIQDSYNAYLQPIRDLARELLAVSGELVQMRYAHARHFMSTVSRDMPHAL